MTPTMSLTERDPELGEIALPPRAQGAALARTLAAAPIASFAFVTALVLSAFALRIGLVPDDAVRLWAGASTAGDGQMSIGRIVAAYPTIPFLTTTLISLLAPDGTPTPALVAAALLGLLAGSWFISFRAAGLPLLAIGAATLLLAFHPTLLRAAIGGSADMFLAVFLYLFGRALYDLRARTSTSEVMAVGLTLLALAFAHPMGAAIAFGAIPFLIFAVRPTLIANSAFNVVVALVFPTLFAVGSFVYVSWVFPGDGWSFFAAPAESLAAWSAAVARMFGDGLTGSLTIDAGLAVLLALALGAPVVVAAIRWVSPRRPLVAPALVFAATVTTAAMIAVATGRFGDPTALAVAAPTLAAVVITRVPIMRERRVMVLALLASGWIGGFASLAIVDPVTTMHLRAAIEGRGADRERIDALALGGATIGRDGVLIDTDNAPAVVLGRGHARGIVSSTDPAFALALLFARIESPFVAVPDPQSAAGAQDRLNKTFPQLYRGGAPGYRLVYQNNTWRLFARR